MTVFSVHSFLADVVSINDLVLPALEELNARFTAIFGEKPRPVEFLRHASVGYVNISNLEIIARNTGLQGGEEIDLNVFDEYIKAFKGSLVVQNPNDPWIQFRARIDTDAGVEEVRNEYAEYYAVRTALCDTVDICKFFIDKYEIEEETLFFFNVEVMQTAALWGVEKAIDLAIENKLTMIVLLFPAKVNAYFDSTIGKFDKRYEQLKEPQNHQSAAFLKRYQIAIDAIKKSVRLIGGDVSRLFRMQGDTYTFFQTHTNRRIHLVTCAKDLFGINDAVKKDDRELTELLHQNQDLYDAFLRQQRRSCAQRNQQIEDGHDRMYNHRLDSLRKLQVSKLQSYFRENCGLTWNPGLAYTVPLDQIDQTHQTAGPREFSPL